MIRLLPLALVAACAALFVSAAPATAAGVPCWKQLLNDWYDGHIDSVYPIHCYHDAIKHLPKDVEVYSSARDDILRALQAAVTHKPVPVTTTNANGQPTTTSEVLPTTKTRTTPKKTRKGPISKAIKDITPGGPGSFPLPLLILGAIAILLVLAGLGGLGWRRWQSRGGA